MKNVIITGGGKGIGNALVQKFLSDGHRVIAISRNIKPLTDLKNNPNLISLSIDITKKGAVNQIIEAFKNKHEIDILINNAGLLINKPFVDTKLEDIQDQIEVNFIAPAILIQSLIPYFNPKGGHVVNITSMGGVQGSSKFPGLAIYSSVKGALNVLTESLATELRETKLKINALALGAVQTEMLNEAFPNYKAPIQAKQIAEFISDFATNGNEYFNGKILQVAMDSP